MGGLSYFSVNLSTLNREQYAKDRGKDHLERVLANLDYARDKALAEEMVIVVLGTDPDEHQPHSGDQRHFAGSRFKVQDFEPNDHAAYLDIGRMVEGRELAVSRAATEWRFAADRASAHHRRRQRRDLLPGLR